MYSKEQRAAASLNWKKKNPEKWAAIKKKSHLKHKDKRNAESRAYRAANRAERIAADKAWVKANPELVAMQRARKRIKEMNTKFNQDLRYHYDITLEHYNEILALQNGVCAICQHPVKITSRSKRLFVDHDHKTGKLRALLCHHCNAGLGYFKENISLFLRAIQYIVACNATSESEWVGRVRFVLAKLSEESSEKRRGKSMEQAK